MRLNDPIIIPLLRFSGALTCGAGAILLTLALQSGTLNTFAFLMAAATGALGLSFFGFATNLMILNEIRSRLQGSGRN